MKVEEISYKDVVLLAYCCNNLAANLAIQDAWECAGANARTTKYYKAGGAIWPDISKSLRKRRHDEGPIRDPKNNKNAWDGFDLKKEIKMFKGEVE